MAASLAHERARVGNEKFQEEEAAAASDHLDQKLALDSPSVSRREANRRDSLELELKEVQKLLRDASEELETWKFRCLRAETEVRALKRQSKKTEGAGQRLPDLRFGVDSFSQASSSQPVSGRVTPHTYPDAELAFSRRASAGACSVSVVSGITCVTDAPAPSMIISESPCNNAQITRLREEIATLQASREELRESCHQSPSVNTESASVVSEAEELRHQLKQKNDAIMQLQVDMVRDKEQHKKSAELKNILCSEELVEMTQRAKSLSEQVVLSGKQSKDLRAIHHKAVLVATERSVKTGDEQPRAATRSLEASTRSIESLEVVHQKVAVVSRDEAVAGMGSGAKYTFRAATASAHDDADVAWEVRNQKVVQGVGVIRQLCSDLQKELRTDKVAKPVEKVSLLRSRRASDSTALADHSASTGSASAEKVMTRLTKQLERLQLLVEQPVPRSLARSSSPEGEHPLPEEQRTMHQMLRADANEIMQQQLNEYCLAAENIRAEMLVEHGTEIDDLVHSFDVERRELHSEILELRAERSKAEVAEVAARPMSDIREHFESQVAILKRELVSQLSDVEEREREKRGVDERELELMRSSLRTCQEELIASQQEFTLLSALFDKERRDNLNLKSSQRVLELQLEAARPYRTASVASSLRHNTPTHAALAPVLSAAVTPAPAFSPRSPVLPPQAIIATAGSPHASSHDVSAALDGRVVDSSKTPEAGGVSDSQPFPVALTPQATSSPRGGTPTVGGATIGGAAIVTPPPKTTGSFCPPPVAATSLGQRAWTTDGSDPGGAAFRAMSMSASKPTLRAPLASPPHSAPVAPPHSTVGSPSSTASVAPAGHVQVRNQAPAAHSSHFPQMPPSPHHPERGGSA